MDYKRKQLFIKNKTIQFKKYLLDRYVGNIKVNGSDQDLEEKLQRYEQKQLSHSKIDSTDLCYLVDEILEYKLFINSKTGKTEIYKKKDNSAVNLKNFENEINDVLIGSNIGSINKSLRSGDIIRLCDDITQSGGLFVHDFVDILKKTEPTGIVDRIFECFKFTDEAELSRSFYKGLFLKYFYGALHCYLENTEYRINSEHVGRTALVLLGKRQNFGKTTWFRRMFGLFPDNPIYIASSMEQITGRFSASMMKGSYLVLLEELQDYTKATNYGTLKSIISSKDLSIEEKFKGSSNVTRSYVFGATTNIEKLLPPTDGSTRFLIFDLVDIDIKIDKILPLGEEGKESWLDFWAEIYKDYRILGKHDSSIFSLTNKELEKLEELNKRHTYESNDQATFSCVFEKPDSLDDRSGKWMNWAEINKKIEEKIGRYYTTKRSVGTIMSGFESRKRPKRANITEYFVKEVKDDY